MKKLLAVVTAMLLTFGFAGMASAARGENNGKAGPNGSNDHGLCTAYFNGQKNGHTKKGSPGPFAALERTADDGDADTSVEQDVYNYCMNVDKGIGGNPGQNGRFTGCFDDGNCNN